MKQNLISKNVTINGRRTSLRLEEELWEALNDVCRCESLTIHKLCSLIDSRRHGSSRTSSVRTFIIAYFRIAAASNGGLAGRGEAGETTGNALNSDIAELMSSIGAGFGKHDDARR
ncbi:MAG TPA: hypothetical protein ENI55_03265 [Alphaproteobacteria bacterium]|nr:hypothetical protein [Alphaproteobacteria bacterium]